MVACAQGFFTLLPILFMIYITAMFRVKTILAITPHLFFSLGFPWKALCFHVFQNLLHSPSFTARVYIYIEQTTSHEQGRPLYIQQNWPAVYLSICNMWRPSFFGIFLVFLCLWEVVFLLYVSTLGFCIQVILYLRQNNLDTTVLMLLELLLPEPYSWHTGV